MKSIAQRLLTTPLNRIIEGKFLEDLDLTRALTVEQVAERLQLPETTVRKMFRNGTLPAVKLGKHWRMSEDVLEKILSGEIQVNTDSDTDD